MEFALVLNNNGGVMLKCSIITVESLWVTAGGTDIVIDESGFSKEHRLISLKIRRARIWIWH
jgi:hypothetical protein